MKPIPALALDLHSGAVTSRDLIESALAEITASDGQGRLAFLHVDFEAARDAADHVDRQRRRGYVASPFAGIPFSVKDLFDIGGQITAAGSRVLAGTPKAVADSPVVASLRAAGMIPVGRTNMTEFAYSGLGINPHHGTPLNPHDRQTGRIPGGSSSGAAISVSDGMAAFGLGTDTGGSCRIPAAFCGLVGYKATGSRLSRKGIVPLSATLDSVGGLGRTIACCAIADSLMSGERLDRPVPEARPVRGLRLFAPQTLVLDGMDSVVARHFEAALAALSDAGADVVEADCPELREVPQINGKGGFAAAESFAWHRPWIAEREDAYDPRVLVRILKGRDQSAADYLDLVRARADWIARMQHRLAPFDAMIMPTVVTVAPALAPLLADDDAYSTANLLALRNPSIANFFDGCSLSLPMQREGSEPPTGLMLVAGRLQDARLFSMAQGISALLDTGHAQHS